MYMSDEKHIHYLCIQAPTPSQRRYYTTHVPDIGKNAIVAFTHAHHCRDLYRTLTSDPPDSASADAMLAATETLQMLATTIASMKAVTCKGMHLPLIVVDNIYCDMESKEVVQDVYLYQEQQHHDA
jgi:hypothetical protein